MNDEKTLKHIYNTYHDMILNAVALWPGRPEVIAGIMMRETRGGTISSRWYKDVDGVEDGDPADNVGDMGHGYGLMQIDGRSFPEFIASGKWRIPQENITFGAQVLYRKTVFLRRKTAGLTLMPGWDVERLGIAAYNCGEGNVLKAVRNGEDPDRRTAHGNYSAAVLNYAKVYARLSLINAPKGV